MKNETYEQGFCDFIDRIEKMSRYAYAHQRYQDVMFRLNLMSLHYDKETSEEYLDRRGALVEALRKEGAFIQPDDTFVTKDQIKRYKWIKNTGLLFEDIDPFCLHDLRIENGSVVKLSFFLKKMSLHEVQRFIFSHKIKIVNYKELKNDSKNSKR